MSQFMTFATLYGFTPIMAKNLKATDFQVGLCFFIYLPAILSSYLSGRIYRRFGGRCVISLCFSLFAADCLFTPFIHSVNMLFVITIIAGFAQGLIFALLMGFVVKSNTAEKRNTAMGFFQAVYGLGMFLGPVIVGIFSGGTEIKWGFVFTTFIGIIAAVISWKIPNSVSETAIPAR